MSSNSNNPKHPKSAAKGSPKAAKKPTASAKSATTAKHPELKHNVLKQTDTEVEFEVTLDAAYIAPHKQHVLDHLRSGVKAAGFRPGKAPDNIVERELGAQPVQNEVMQDLIVHSYSALVTQLALETLSEPEITLQKFVPYTELTYRAKAMLVPPIDLPDLAKLKVDLKPETVSEADLEQALEQLSQASAERKIVERAAQLGDEVKLDFVGTRDGQPIEGAAADGQVIALGSGRFIPGFEEEIVGMKADTEKVFTITFPSDYFSKDLAGAEVNFQVKLHEVNEVTLPDIDDEFAVKMGGFKDLDELKADVRQHLQDGKDEQNRKAQRDAIIEATLAATKVSLPATLVDGQVSELRHELEHQLSHQGMDEEKYLASLGQSKADFERELRTEAERRVKLGLVLRKVVGDQQLDVPLAELNEELERMRQQYSEPEAVAQMNAPSFRDDLANRLLSEKAIAYIVNQATK